jgi:hypothetical protein
VPHPLPTLQGVGEKTSTLPNRAFGFALEMSADVQHGARRQALKKMNRVTNFIRPWLQTSLLDIVN